MKRWLILFCLAQHFLFAVEGEPIGTVIVLEGLVKAIDAGNGERILSKGSAIFLSETIQTGSKAKAQIRFTDNGVMNVIPNSAFRVDSYRYRAAGQKDRFIANLIKGGFRSLSGSIAKKNPKEYELQTPSATIGLRGTIIEASIVKTKTFVGVTDGRAIVTNGGGSQLIGVGEKGQFVLVSSSDIQPKLISQRPSELDLKIFVPPQGGVNIDQLNLRQTGKIGSQQSTPEATTKASSNSASSAKKGQATKEASKEESEEKKGPSTQGKEEVGEEATSTSEAAPSETAPAEPPVEEGTAPTSETSTTGTTSDSTSSSTEVPLTPTIGETQEPSDFQFQPTGGGGAISGGC